MAETEWTIATLKELLESLDRKNERALELQAKEYERRLDGLNGEQTRIAATQATYVSRELWEKAQSDSQEWRGRIDVAMQSLLTKAEFQIYKETTNKALQLKEGEGRGIGLSAGVIVGTFALLASLATVISVFYLIAHKA